MLAPLNTIKEKKEIKKNWKLVALATPLNKELKMYDFR